MQAPVRTCVPFPYISLTNSSLLRRDMWVSVEFTKNLCAYQCYAPLPPVWAIVGQCGDLINLPQYNQIPLQKVGDYWGVDTRSVTVQYTETVAVFKVSSEVIKCPTIGAASFGQSPYVARLLPVRGVWGIMLIGALFSTLKENIYAILVDWDNPGYVLVLFPD